MAASDEAKRIIQAERRKLSRAASSAASQRMDKARNELRRAGTRATSVAEAANDEALYKGLIGLIRSVGTTWNISVPISLSMTMNNTISASTDFSSISIGYPQSMVPKNNVGGFDDGLLRSFIADVKGISYHEIGHNRFTTPYPVLWDLVNPGIAVNAEYHRAWNILEDQRMEAAVVEDSPIIADYFTTMTIQHILKNMGSGSATPLNAMQWVLLVGRRYLPSDIRREFRRMFVDQFGVDAQLKLDTIVSTYMCATNAVDMMNEVIKLKKLLETLNIQTLDSMDNHNDYYFRRPSQYGGEGEHLEKIKKSAASGEESDDGESSSGSEGKDKEEGDDKKSGSGQASEDKEEGDDKESGSTKSSGEGDDFNTGLGSDGDSEEGDGPPAPGTPGGYGSGEKSITERLKERVDAIREQQVIRDRSIDDTIRTIYENAYSKNSSLPTYRSVGSQRSEDAAKAELAVAEITKALECYTAEDAPIWQSRQTRGIIDPFAYRTKTGGSMEYRRQYNDHGGQSIDLAVTVMLDVSGSMGGAEYELGAAAYACKKACENLDIPCTVTTFEDGGYVLWGPNDKAEHTAVMVGGGTNPYACCEVLDEQQGDKSNHLVLVMTDGQFNNSFPGFQHFGNNGRYFILFQYGGGWYGSDAAMQAHHPHEYTLINDLMDIPKTLAGFVAAFLR